MNAVNRRAWLRMLSFLPFDDLDLVHSSYLFLISFFLLSQLLLDSTCFSVF